MTPYIRIQFAFLFEMSSSAELYRFNLKMVTEHRSAWLPRFRVYVKLYIWNILNIWNVSIVLQRYWKMIETIRRWFIHMLFKDQLLMWLTFEKCFDPCDLLWNNANYLMNQFSFLKSNMKFRSIFLQFPARTLSHKGNFLLFIVLHLFSVQLSIITAAISIWNQQLDFR